MKVSKPIPIQNPEPNMDSVLKVLKQLKDAVEQLQKQLKDTTNG